MAKKFLDLFQETKETVYSNVAQAITVLASLNTAADFTPNLAPNGSTSTSKYTLQRRKRPSVNTVAKPNSGATSDALAALDQFTTIDWESLEVVTGALRSVGFKQTFNDDYDFSLDPKHSKDMLYQVGEVAVQRKTDFITLFETFTPSGTALPAYAEGKTEIWDAVGDEVLRLGSVDDEYKTKQGLSDFVVYMDAYTAKDIAKEVGTVFNQEAPIAQTGFTSNKSVNGTPVIVDSTLAKGTVYVIHNEALAFKSNVIEKDINVDLGLTQFTGKFFYDVMALVDGARASKIAATPKP